LEYAAYTCAFEDLLRSCKVNLKDQPISSLFVKNRLPCWYWHFDHDIIVRTDCGFYWPPVLYWSMDFTNSLL